MSDLPEALPQERRKNTIHVVWLIPILAALIGGWMALQSVLERGPTITIHFKSAEGIEAGKTRIRYKSVDIGTVRAVKLSEDGQSVEVSAEMARQGAKRFLVEDTRFWVVRPRIAGGQVSGLTTLLAGAYIGADPGKSEQSRRDFPGLETPPVITSEESGRQFTLAADNLGSLDVGSPLYYRGVAAGRVVSADLAPDGRRVDVGIFVHAPFDRWVNPETRFWNASGIDLSLDANGLKLQSESLVTLVLGGIAFETPEESAGLPPSGEKSRFSLWDNRAEAMRLRDNVVETYAIVFEQSVRGLSVGAPVDFRGIPVGEVRAIDLEFDREAVAFRTQVTIHLYPERMRPKSPAPNARWSQLTPQQRMERLVDRGLRAQLKTANLVTGQMLVTLDMLPKAPKAKLDVSVQPPRIPAVNGGLAQLEESLTNIAGRLEKVPFDELAKDLRRTLGSLEAALKRAEATMARIDGELAPELRATLEQAKRTLGAAEQVLATDSPAQGDLRETLNEVSRAAEQVRGLADYLERHPESLLRGKPKGESR
jgi:paraquat-inducible protein B